MTTIGIGSGDEIQVLKEMNSRTRSACFIPRLRFIADSGSTPGEYKLMGLAPGNGEPRFEKIICDELIDLKEDGSFRLNMDYFAYLSETRMTNRKFDSLFGGPARRAEGTIETRFPDVSRLIEAVTEEIMLQLLAMLAMSRVKGICAWRAELL